MSKLLLAILFSCLPALMFAQASAPSSRYQAGTIIQIKPHQTDDTSDQSPRVYEVSVTVNGTTYVVLTSPPSGEPAMLYAVGRQVLVQVRDNAIIWTDILGQSHEVPILVRSPIVDSSKTQN
jgi:hypothetical protein